MFFFLSVEAIGATKLLGGMVGLPAGVVLRRLGPRACSVFALVLILASGLLIWEMTLMAMSAPLGPGEYHNKSQVYKGDPEPPSLFDFLGHLPIDPLHRITACALLSVCFGVFGEPLSDYMKKTWLRKPHYS